MSHNSLFQCQPIINSELRIDAYRCCCRNSTHNCTNVSSLSQNHSTMCSSIAPSSSVYLDPPFDSNVRNLLLIINAISAITSLLLVSLVVRQRKTQVCVCVFVSIEQTSFFQQYGARGWALMELFLVGAALLYSIVSGNCRCLAHCL